MSIVLPAVGQGALGLETRRDDRQTRESVQQLNHPPTHRAVLAERAMLAALNGGCLAPVAAWARMENDRLTLTGRVLSADGVEMLEETLSTAPPDAIELGRKVADVLLARGADRLISVSREQP